MMRHCFALLLTSATLAMAVAFPCITCHGNKTQNLGVAYNTYLPSMTTHNPTQPSPAHAPWMKDTTSLISSKTLSSASTAPVFRMAILPTIASHLVTVKDTPVSGFVPSQTSYRLVDAQISNNIVRPINTTAEKAAAPSSRSSTTSPGSQLTCSDLSHSQLTS